MKTTEEIVKFARLRMKELSEHIKFTETLPGQDTETAKMLKMMYQGKLMAYAEILEAIRGD